MRAQYQRVAHPVQHAWPTRTLTLRTLILLVSMLFPACNIHADEGECLNRAVDWLVEQQDESGAFKSKHYGAMKQGAALTSLSLYAMSMTPHDYHVKHREIIQKSFDFLLTGTMQRGRVANPDGSLDHDVYSTAMFLIAARKLDRKLDRKLVRHLIDFLLNSQCAESRGFDKGNPNYGGWDVIGPDVMPGKTSGANVSVTRFVLEALDWYVPVNGYPDYEYVNNRLIDRINDSRRKASRWLKQLQEQTGDGGFLFTAQPRSALNKAKSINGRPISYCSATCDGLLAMTFAGQRNWKKFESAKKWISKNATASEVAGFPDADESGWSDAIKFYHLQVLSRANLISGKLEQTEATKVQILEVLRDAQNDDGSFRNESSLMRENDPIVATSFAIVALGNLNPRDR